MRTKTTALAALCVALLGTVGCDHETKLDTRTFALKHLEPWTAEGIIRPYVFTDRAGAPGTLSTAAGSVTVRETADNLDKIERVLAEFDVPRPDVQLRFQLIEADGFTDSDPAIAEVEQQLRQVFQFKGYRLAGEAVVSATDGSEVSQYLAPAQYQVQARVRFTQPGSVRLEEVSLFGAQTGVRLLSTTVNVRPGQTLVVGTAAKEKSTATLLLTLRAEEPGQG